MMNARMGKFYFEALEEILDGLEMQIMDLDDAEFKNCTTNERILALRKLYKDLDNLVPIRTFLE